VPSEGSEVEDNTAELAAYVQNDVRDIINYPTTTAGVRIEGRGLRRSKMTVSRNICWYLDTTFCYNFHRMNETGINVLLMMQLVSAVIYVISGLILLFVLIRILQSVTCPHTAFHPSQLAQSLTRNLRSRARGGLFTPRGEGGRGSLTPRGAPSPGAAIPETPREPAESDQIPNVGQSYCGSRRCDSLLEYLGAMPISLVLFGCFWLIFLPIFYLEVFIPCYECYDFQATIAHEIGHILGFDHPDSEPELNLRATNVAMGPATCSDPLAQVELAPLPEGSDSLMFSVTRHRPKNCLTSDDLEGLNFLYPSCHQPVLEPQCNVSPRLSGYLRLAIAVGFPYVLVTILLLMLQCCVRSFHSRKASKLEGAVRHLYTERFLLQRQASKARRETRHCQNRLNLAEASLASLQNSTSVPRGSPSPEQGNGASTHMFGWLTPRSRRSQDPADCRAGGAGAATFVPGPFMRGLSSGLGLSLGGRRGAAAAGGPQYVPAERRECQGRAGSAIDAVVEVSRLDSCSRDSNASVSVRHSQPSGGERSAPRASEASPARGDRSVSRAEASLQSEHSRPSQSAASRPSQPSTLHASARSTSSSRDGAESWSSHVEPRRPLAHLELDPGEISDDSRREEEEAGRAPPPRQYPVVPPIPINGNPPSSPPPGVPPSSPPPGLPPGYMEAVAGGGSGNRRNSNRDRAPMQQSANRAPSPTSVPPARNSPQRAQPAHTSFAL